MNVKQKNMLAALTANMGNVSKACKAAAVSRAVHYQWINSSEEYREAVEDSKEEILDFAESALHKLIESGNVTATIFFLKTIGKGRGYVEKLETENKVLYTGRPIISFSDTSFKGA